MREPSAKRRAGVLESGAIIILIRTIPRFPLAYDLEHAPFIEWSYVIVSVRNGVASDIRSWNVRDDRSQFDEEKIFRSNGHAEDLYTFSTSTICRQSGIDRS